MRQPAKCQWHGTALHAFSWHVAVSKCNGMDHNYYIPQPDHPSTGLWTLNLSNLTWNLIDRGVFFSCPVVQSPLCIMFDHKLLFDRPVPGATELLPRLGEGGQ